MVYRIVKPRNNIFTYDDGDCAGCLCPPDTIFFDSKEQYEQISRQSASYKELKMKLDFLERDHNFLIRVINRLKILDKNVVEYCMDLERDGN